MFKRGFALLVLGALLISSFSFALNLPIVGAVTSQGYCESGDYKYDSEGKLQPINCVPDPGATETAGCSDAYGNPVECRDQDSEKIKEDCRNAIQYLEPSDAGYATCCDKYQICKPGDEGVTPTTTSEATATVSETQLPDDPGTLFFSDCLAGKNPSDSESASAAVSECEAKYDAEVNRLGKESGQCIQDNCADIFSKVCPARKPYPQAYDSCIENEYRPCISSCQASYLAFVPGISGGGAEYEQHKKRLEQISNNLINKFKVVPSSAEDIAESSYVGEGGRYFRPLIGRSPSEKRAEEVSTNGYFMLSFLKRYSEEKNEVFSIYRSADSTYLLDHTTGGQAIFEGYGAIQGEQVVFPYINANSFDKNPSVPGKYSANIKGLEGVGEADVNTIEDPQTGVQFLAVEMAVEEEAEPGSKPVEVEITKDGEPISLIPLVMDVEEPVEGSRSGGSRALTYIVVLALLGGVGYGVFFMLKKMKKI